MKVVALRKKTTDELHAFLQERLLRREELGELLRQRKVKNTKELREVRKDVARALTLLRGTSQ